MNELQSWVRHFIELATPTEDNHVDEVYHCMIEFMKHLLTGFCQNQEPLPCLTEVDVSQYIKSL